MKVIKGNNIESLKQYPDNYFDAVVTDAPYGLGKEPIAEEVMKDWVEKGYHEISGSGFMGKEWDAFVPQPVFWKEVFRVLKHGGHVVAFYGTRTYDWGVMSMRFAGFEVRDCIQWLYGSGFPKSHNISKAINKIEGVEYEEHPASGVGFMKPDSEDWNVTKNQLIQKGESSENAKQWEGWGTALKPANEPIVLARKPLEKGLSIAENVLKWGTGGINIDGCRIATSDEILNHSSGSDSAISKGKYGDSKEQETHQTEGQKLGRFPANLILTHHADCELKGLKKVSHSDSDGMEVIEDWTCHENCPIRIMDEQSGINESKRAKRGNGIGNGFHGSKAEYDTERGHSHIGGASRFFYCAKASKSERNNGLKYERWFYNLELVLHNYSFTEQNLFIWEQEELNQNMDLNGEAQRKRDISEGIVLLVEDKECYTTLFGKEKEVLFPKAIKFTTSTGISQIIELKTLNFYQHLNISDCIADVIETNKENGLNLVENVGIKNLLKQIFIKDKLGFLLGVKIVAKKIPQLINVKDVWRKTNIHSTVKPVKLMQYLVRMITPPNGIVLDPFCGSGTTGIACKLEGFDFVGMEQDAEYCKIAEARIMNYEEEPEDQLELIEESDENKAKYIQAELF
jgi:DNA modification methylase